MSKRSRLNSKYTLATLASMVLYCQYCKYIVELETMDDL